MLSEDAPQDRPISVSTEDQMEAFYRLQEPYNKLAMESYPQAKQRFLTGLHEGENFFLTTRLKDDAGRIEQVFVLIKSIEGTRISGIIYNDIYVVSGYKNGQAYEFSESEIYDWLITKPDGTEEGNFVGKFLDSLQKQ